MHPTSHGARLQARGHPLRNPHHCTHNAPPSTSPLLRTPASPPTLPSLSHKHTHTHRRYHLAIALHRRPPTHHSPYRTWPRARRPTSSASAHSYTHPLLTPCHAPMRRHTHGAEARRHATPVNTSAPARGPVQVSPGQTRVNTAQTAQPATAQSQQTHTRTHRAHTHTPCTHQQPSSLS